jgi:hypothetical protein
MQFLLLASELRTRAEEILVRAANTNNREVQEMMRVVAAGYEKLARQIEQRVREAEQGLEHAEAHPTTARHGRWQCSRRALRGGPEVYEPGGTPHGVSSRRF